MTRRVIITGTREELSAEDREIVIDVLAPYIERATEIGVGDCPSGVDRLVREIARERRRDGLPQVATFIANWQGLGRRAGPERNGRMVAWAAEADAAFAPRSPHRATGLGVLLAFPGPRSRGTWDCVRQARAAGLDVVIKRVGGAR